MAGQHIFASLYNSSDAEFKVKQCKKKTFENLLRNISGARVQVGCPQCAIVHVHNRPKASLENVEFLYAFYNNHSRRLRNSINCICDLTCAGLADHV
jgi:hypothetical protein